MNFRSQCFCSAVLAALIVLSYGAPYSAATRALSAPRGLSTVPKGKGRIYIFRMVRPSGAHLDDYLTIDGVAVQRITPGNALYCDVSPGDYVLGLSRHRTQPLKVSVSAGQEQYIRVMLHHGDGISPRRGSPPSDQSFDIRLVDPGCGAARVKEYHLTQADCHH
jgi:hypothetical protein